MHINRVVAAVSAFLFVACGTAHQEPERAATGHLFEGKLVMADGTVRTIQYEMINGDAIFEGDIVLTPVASDSAQFKALSKAWGIADASGLYQTGQLWPANGTIDFTINPNLGNRNCSGPVTVACPTGGVSAAFTVLQAIQEYNAKTGFVFVERPFPYSGLPSLTFLMDDKACASSVGNISTSTPQSIWVGGAPASDAGPAVPCGFGATVHEIGHALGLYHEHKRTDRPSGVVINQPTTDGAICNPWTDQCSADYDSVPGTYLSDYDFSSIMHYAPNAVLSAPTSPCEVIAPGQAPGWGTCPGQRVGLSSRDVLGLQVMYGNEFEPTIAQVGTASDSVEAFIRGVDGDVWRRQLQPATNGFAWADLGGPVLGGPEVVGWLGTSWGAGRFDLFARRASDRALLHKVWSPSTGYQPSQTGWADLGGTLYAHPAVVTQPSLGRIDIFSRDVNGSVIWKRWTGSAWLPSQTGWTVLGDFTIGPIAAVSWGPNRIDLFYVDGSHQLAHRWTDDGVTFAGPESLGGPAASYGKIFGRPSVVSWEASRLDIFVKGGDGAVYHKYWTPTSGGFAPAAWEPLYGTITGNPTAVAWGPNRLDLYVHDMANGMSTKSWTGSGWTGWLPMGGGMRGTPAPSTRGVNLIDVFVRGNPTPSLFQKSFAGSWTGWIDHGNNINW